MLLPKPRTPLVRFTPLYQNISNLHCSREGVRNLPSTYLRSPAQPQVRIESHSYRQSSAPNSRKCPPHLCANRQKYLRKPLSQVSHKFCFMPFDKCLVPQSHGQFYIRSIDSRPNKMSEILAPLRQIRLTLATTQSFRSSCTNRPK